MGRGRQKAKQTKIARKLKYLTTDTDYDELAKELSHQDDEVLLDDISVTYEEDGLIAGDTSRDGEDNAQDQATGVGEADLDEYAAWAAEAAKRAEEKPVVKMPTRKPFPKMPVPEIKPKDAE